MSRVLRSLALSACLALALTAVAHAAGIPSLPPATAFLAGLSPSAPCPAQPAPLVTGDKIPVPQPMVIYMACGVNCSDYSCSGAQAGDFCDTDAGTLGTCHPHNAICTGEAFHSPCTCS
jgi:hypothetical protein